MKMFGSDTNSGIKWIRKDKSFLSETFASGYLRGSRGLTEVKESTPSGSWRTYLMDPIGRWKCKGESESFRRMPRLHLARVTKLVELQVRSRDEF